MASIKNEIRSNETRSEYLARVNAEDWADRKVARSRGRLTLRPLSHVAHRTESGAFACPHCGGTTYAAKRPMRRKIALNIFAVFTPKSLLQCTSCGATYARG